ncbi:hypothetical protein LCGC14_3097990, partial [marine sediment metagenome]
MVDEIRSNEERSEVLKAENEVASEELS